MCQKKFLSYTLVIIFTFFICNAIKTKKSIPKASVEQVAKTQNNSLISVAPVKKDAKTHVSPSVTLRQATSDKTKNSEKECTLTLNNCIEKETLGYKYGFIKYCPSKFSISVDGKKIESGENLTIPVPKDNKLEVRYDYEFMNGYRKGAKKVRFDLKPEAQKCNISFSWKDKYRIKIDNALPIEAEEIQV